MRTNEDIARWCETRAALTLNEADHGMLKSAAAALRGLDAQPDADNSVFHVAFDTASEPGLMVVTTVRLGVEAISMPAAQRKAFDVALCNHPSYPNLRQYVLANPEAVPNLPKSLHLNGDSR